MELVANVWPIVDQMTGVVQRFLFRAYALNATDQEISTVLTILANALTKLRGIKSFTVYRLKIHHIFASTNSLQTLLLKLYPSMLIIFSFASVNFNRYKVS